MNLKSLTAAMFSALCISLTLSFAQEEPLRFAFLTDLHYSQGGRSVQDLRRCIRDVNALDGLDFVLIGGDLTDFGTDEEIRDVKGMLDSLHTRYYTVAGNHDAKWSESGCNTFKEVFGYERFEFVCKGWRFIGCNCGPDMRMAPALIPQESMEWLRSLPESGKTIFINHYPQETSVLNYFDVTRELKRIGTRFAIGGHWHRNTVLDYGGIPGVLGRSTLSAGKEPGYTIISIQDDSVTVRERRLCTDGPVLEEPWFCKRLFPVEDKVEYDSDGLPSDYPWMRYDVNGLPSPSGKTVKEVWKYKDNSNIVAGFARRRGKAWYATASGMVRCISLKDGRIRSERQCEYVRPIAFGLLDGEENQQAADDLNALVIKDGYHLNTGFLSTPDLCRVLAENGHVDTAYKLLLQEDCPSWLYEVKKGATTVWETWDGVRPDGTVHDSLNHYSYGAICGWLFGGVCGIHLEAGRLTIRPFPHSSLGHAQAEWLSPVGKICSGWRYENDTIQMHIEVPVPAEILLPDGRKYQVKAGAYSYEVSL